MTVEGWICLTTKGFNVVKGVLLKDLQQLDSLTVLIADANIGVLPHPSSLPHPLVPHPANGPSSMSGLQASPLAQTNSHTSLSPPQPPTAQEGLIINGITYSAEIFTEPSPRYCKAVFLALLAGDGLSVSEIADILLAIHPKFASKTKDQAIKDVRDQIWTLKCNVSVSSIMQACKD